MGLRVLEPDQVFESSMNPYFFSEVIETIKKCTFHVNTVVCTILIDPTIDFNSDIAGEMCVHYNWYIFKSN